MDNSKMNYLKKFLNILYVVILSIPIIFMLIVSFTPLKNADGGDITTDTHTETTVEYYQTNEVNSVDDLIVGNIYAMDLYQINMNGYLRINYYFECIDYKIYTNYMNIDEGLSPIVFNNTITCYLGISEPEDIYVYYGNIQDNLYYNICYTMDPNNNSYFWVILSSDMLNNVMFEDSINDGFIYNNIPLPQVLKSVSQQTIEGTRYNYDLLNGFYNFYTSPLNSWYSNSLLSFFGVSVSNHDMFSYMMLYPIWLFWVSMLKLFVDILTLFPKLARKLFTRGD